MEHHETKKPLQIAACKGFWNVMTHHETLNWSGRYPLKEGYKQMIIKDYLLGKK